MKAVAILVCLCVALCLVDGQMTYLPPNSTFISSGSWYAQNYQTQFYFKVSDIMQELVTIQAYSNGLSEQIYNLGTFNYSNPLTISASGLNTTTATTLLVATASGVDVANLQISSSNVMGGQVIVTVTDSLYSSNGFTVRVCQNTCPQVCPSDCSGNGLCHVSNATCACNIGFTGDDCAHCPACEKFLGFLIGSIALTAFILIGIPIIICCCCVGWIAYCCCCRKKHHHHHHYNPISN